MELESLQIQITSDAKTANAAIDSLVNRLIALKTALGGFKAISFGSITKSAISANSSLTMFSSTITNLSQNLKIVNNNISILNKQLSGVRIESSVSTSIDAITASMRKLGGKQISSAISNLPKLATGLQLFNKEINGIGALKFDTASLTSFVTSISRLGGKASTQAVANLPRLTVELKNLMNELSKAPAVSENLVRMTEALSRLARTGRSSGTAATSLANSFSLFGNRVNFTRKSAFSLASAIGKVYATYWSLFRVFRLLRDAINISSAVTEADNVVRQAFGKYEKLVDDLCKVSIKKFGMSELSVKQFAGRFQSLGTALDIPQGKMAKMAITLTELTGDLASYYDVSQEDVAKSLQSVFTGTTAPMRRYGVDLTQATLNEWLMKKGIDAKVKSMNQAQKAVVRYEYTLERTKAAQGDFLRTSDSWHNTLTVVKESFKDLGKTVGDIAINAFKPFLRVLGIVAEKVNSFVEMVLNALGSIFGWKFEVSKKGASGLADSLNGAYDSMDDLSDAAGSAGKNTGDVAKNAKKAKKEIQQATRAFDELKVISKQSKDNTSGSGNGGSGGGSGGSGGGGTGTWVETPSAFKKFKSSIKDLEGLGESIRDSLVKAVGGIEWDKIYAKASGFGSGLASFLNGLFSEDKKGNSVFTATADVIAGALNTAIFASKGFTDKFDFKTLGTNLAHGFNRFFKKFKWKQCAEAINGWVDGFWKFVQGFFNNLSWGDIFNGLKTFLTNLSPSSVITLLGLAGGKLAPTISAALCSILGFTGGGKGKGKNFILNGLGLVLFAETIAYQLSNKKFDFTSACVEALAAGGAAFYMSGGNPDFLLGGVTVSVGISLGKFFVEKSDKMKKAIKDFKKEIDLKLGKKITVTGWDGKKKTLLVPKSQEKNKVHKNAYPSDEKGKQRLAENTDWYRKQKEKKEEEKKGHGIAGMPDEARRFVNTQKRNERVRAENKKKVISNHSTSEIYSVVNGYAKSKPQKIKVKAVITSADDKIKNKKLKGFTAGLEKKKDSIPMKLKGLDDFTANISKNKDSIPKKLKGLDDFTANLNASKDKIKLSDKSLKNFTANLSKNKDLIPSKLKSLNSYTANLSNDKDKIPKGYKILNNYTAKLVENKDKIKSSDKKLDNYTGKLTKTQDNIRPADKKIGGFTAKITSFVNEIKNKFLDFAARLTGKSTKKADGGVFSGGSWKPIKKYAVGGLPNMGQMFVAREAGPELVGTLGGHTAVMNNDQIVSSVSFGVAQAVKEVIQPLLKTSVGNNRPIQISLDGKVIFDSTRKSAQEYFNRTGISPFPV